MQQKFLRKKCEKNRWIFSWDDIHYECGAFYDGKGHRMEGCQWVSWFWHQMTARAVNMECGNFCPVEVHPSEKAVLISEILRTEKRSYEGSNSRNHQHNKIGSTDRRRECGEVSLRTAKRLWRICCSKCRKPIKVWSVAVLNILRLRAE